MPQYLIFRSPTIYSQAEIDKVYTFITINQEQLQPHIPDDLLQEPRLDRLEDKTNQKAWKALETPDPKSAYKRKSELQIYQ